jgi:hypothetical protein
VMQSRTSAAPTVTSAETQECEGRLHLSRRVT